MAKGIIIDIGFKADIQDFINDIQKEFTKIDFDGIVGLSDSFDKQAKEVRTQLAKLKQEIDEAVGGKLPDDYNKQLQALNKAVALLTSSFKEMAKNVPNLDTTITGQIDAITQDMQHLSNICSDATSAIHDVSKAANGKVKIVDSSQKKQLEEIFYTLERGAQALEKFYTSRKKHGNQPYIDEEDALRDIIAQNEIYEQSLKEIKAIEDDTALSSQERIEKLDKLYATFAQTISNLARTINSYGDLGGDLGENIGSSLTKNGTKTLEKLQSQLETYYDGVLGYIAHRKAEIQKTYYDIGGGDLQDTFKKSVAKDEAIKIPVVLGTSTKALYNKTLTLINEVQSKLGDKPLEVEVKLLSTYRSNKNSKILEQIAGDIDNIGDEDVKKKILSLINDIQQSIDGVGEFSIKIKTEYATNAVRKFVADAKDELNQLSENLAPLEPELILTQEHREAFQKQINEAKGDFTIQVGIMDGNDTIDNNATKKELSYLKLLREYIEAVESAVNKKSLAFIDELGVVQDVIPDERDLLNQLYGDLLLIESQIEDITAAFKLIPTVFHMEIDPDTFDSLDNLINSDVLNKLADAKNAIYQELNNSTGLSLEIPSELKDRLLLDINTLASELNNIFNTQGIQNWGFEFNQILDDIGQKIRELFGSNTLNDWIQDMQFSDELMKNSPKHGDKHLRERVAVLGDDGKLYGSGMYDQPDSAGLIYDVIKALQKKGIIPKVGIHSHGSDRIAASSISQINKDTGKLEGADIAANYFEYIHRGIEKQITLALNDIEVFDAKGFYDSNHNINFEDEKIKELIANKRDEIVTETNKVFYQFFEKFVNQYGSGNGNTLKDSLFKEHSKRTKFSFTNNKLEQAIQDSINPSILLTNFYSQLQNQNNKNNLGRALAKALVQSFDKSKIDTTTLAVDSKQVESVFREFLDTAKNKSKNILDNAFNLSQFDYDTSSGKTRDLFTFNFRQLTPRILNEALVGTGYKNNYQDFLKAYTTEEFIKQNPLGLSSGTLSDMFNTSIPNSFLETIDKIISGLTDIKNLSSEGFLSKAFEIKIDDKSLKSFVAEINKLIEELQKLPSTITEAFSNISFTTPINRISDIDKRIQDLNVQLQDTEQQIKDTQAQIDSFNKSKKSKTQDSVLSTTQPSFLSNIQKWISGNRAKIANGSIGLPEQFMLANLNTGYATSSDITGEVAGITRELVEFVLQNALQSINAAIHSHPEETTAAFSYDDIEKAVKYYGENVIYQIVTSLNDIAMLDVSAFDKEDLLEISNRLKEATIDELGLIKDDEALVSSFSEDFDNSLQFIFNNIISRLKEQYPATNIEKYTEEWKEQLINNPINTSNWDEIRDSIFLLFQKVSNSFNINDIDIIDNAFQDSVQKFIQDFQEKMLLQIIDDMSKNGELVRSVNINNIYKKFSLDEFNRYINDDYDFTPPSRNVDDAHFGSNTETEQDVLKVLTEQLLLLKNREDALKRQLKLLTEQKQQITDSKQDRSAIDSKTEAFNTEGDVVDTIINEEIAKLKELEQALDKVADAVDAKTEAFKNEGKVVGEIVNDEVLSLSPLQNLESSYNIFKQFYDNGNINSKEGASAALSYYTAYKEALLSKANKKDLQQFTIGKMSDLFTGNYTNYKKGTDDLDLSGLDAEILKYQEVLEKFNQPEVINIINALTEAIEKLLATGNGSEKATKLLENLNKTISNLGGKTGAEKIVRITENLENFQKSINALNLSDSGFVQSLSSILEKGKELKALGEVLKATKKQIDSANKAVHDATNYNKAADYLQKNEQQINNAVEQTFAGTGDNILYKKLEATKEGLVQVTALVKKADDTYKKYTLTIDQNGKVQHKAIDDNEQKLSKEIKAWELYQKLKANFIDEPNLGDPAKTFTLDSPNWSKLEDKISDFGIALEDVEKIIRKLDEAGNESFQIFTDLSRITIGIDSKGVLFQTDEVFASKEAIEQYENSLQKLKKLLSKGFKGDYLSIQEFVNTLTETENLWAKINKLKGKGFISDEDKARLLKYNEAFQKTIATISLDKISKENKTPEFLKKIELADQQLTNVKKILSKIDAEQVISDDEIQQIKIFIDLIKDLMNTAGNAENRLSKSTTIDKVLGKIADILEKNTKMSKELEQDFINLSDEIKSFGDSIPNDKAQEFTARFERLNRLLKESGKTGRSFFDLIGKKITGISANFIAQYFSFQDFIRYIRQAFETIREYDKALTDMVKVSKESISTLKQFQNESFKLANTIGTTASQIQQSTADFMRLGESLEQAKQSAQDANILFNVSEFESIDAATESLVSMSQAFKELGKREIIDVVNNLGNNFAISTDGLASALQNSASALKTAKNDFFEAAALTTAANTVVQDPNKVGAGLRTIALRLTGTEAAKKELEELGEDVTDFQVTTTAKLDESIKMLTKTHTQAGISLLDMNGNYRSTYEVLLDIAEVWEQIAKEDLVTGENRQNALLEMMAGKNRSNILASILQSPETLKEAYAYALDSDGSAQKENEAYLKSIEGHLQQIKNLWDDLWVNENNREFINFFLDLAKAVLEVVNEFGALNTILVGGTGIFTAIKGKGLTNMLHIIVYESLFRRQCNNATLLT